MSIKYSKATDSCIDHVAAESSSDDQASTDVLGLLAQKSWFNTDYYLRYGLLSSDNIIISRDRILLHDITVHVPGRDS